jgi:hypothetical protein
MIQLLKAAVLCVVTVLPSALQPLDIATGKWIYHGQQFPTAFTKAGGWTWNVDCGWSANRIFLICSFVMNWPEGPDRSVTLTTYNKATKSYWHYEVIDDLPGNKPVVSRMAIAGNTWTESTENVNANGKNAARFRVVYTYTSPARVEVKFQTSKDAIHWTTLGQGVGLKQL